MGLLGGGCGGIFDVVDSVRALAIVIAAVDAALLVAGVDTVTAAGAVLAVVDLDLGLASLVLLSQGSKAICDWLRLCVHCQLSTPLHFHLRCLRLLHRCCRFSFLARFLDFDESVRKDQNFAAFIIYKFPKQYYEKRQKLMFCLKIN